MHFAHREYLQDRHVIPRTARSGLGECIPKFVLPISEPASFDVRSINRSNKSSVSVVPGIGTKRISKTFGVHGYFGGRTIAITRRARVTVDLEHARIARSGALCSAHYFSNTSTHRWKVSTPACQSNRRVPLDSDRKRSCATLNRCSAISRSTRNAAAAREESKLWYFPSR